MRNNEFGGENSGEEDFGLPKVDYKPLEDTAGVGYEPNQGTPQYFDEEDGGSNNTAVIVLVVLLVLAAGAFSAYQFWYVPRVEQEKQELLARQAREAAAKEKERQEQLRREAEEAAFQARQDSIAQAKADSLARAQQSLSAPIEVLHSPVGAYHVILSSNVDDDLLMDFAKKMRRKGVGAKLIAPYGSQRLYRLAMRENYASYEAATAASSSVGSEYAQGSAWVLKY